MGPFVIVSTQSTVGFRNGVISGRNSIQSDPSFAQLSGRDGLLPVGRVQEELLPEVVISHDDETHDAAVTASPRLPP
jgi:hypothetical protein